MSERDRNAPWTSKTGAPGTCPRCSTFLTQGFGGTLSGFYVPVDDTTWRYLKLEDRPPTFKGPKAPLYACPSCELLLAGIETKPQPAPQ